MVIDYTQKKATVDDFKYMSIVQTISLLCQGVNAEQKNKEKIEALKKELQALSK